MQTEATRLRSLVDSFMDQAHLLDWNQPYAPGKWLRIQVLGHLVDSASNNHQRFVRALMQPDLTFPDYKQQEWVAVQFYAKTDVANVLDLWAAYNFHLAHVMEHIPDQKLQTPCTIGEYPTATLAYLVKDYNDHLEHHLGQLTA